MRVVQNAVVRMRHVNLGRCVLLSATISGPSSTHLGNIVKLSLFLSIAVGTGAEQAQPVLTTKREHTPAPPEPPSRNLRGSVGSSHHSLNHVFSPSMLSQMQQPQRLCLVHSILRQPHSSHCDHLSLPRNEGTLVTVHSCHMPSGPVISLL